MSVFLTRLSLCVFQLVASIVFISFGVVAAFCCAIVDGVFAARHIVRTVNTTGALTKSSNGNVMDSSALRGPESSFTLRAGRIKGYTDDEEGLTLSLKG